RKVGAGNRPGALPGLTEQRLGERPQRAGGERPFLGPVLDELAGLVDGIGALAKTDEALFRSLLERPAQGRDAGHVAESRLDSDRAVRERFDLQLEIAAQRVVGLDAVAAVAERLRARGVEPADRHR